MTARRARVGELAEQLRGVSFAKGEAYDAPRAGLTPILRAGNITDDGLLFEDLVFVPSHRVSAQQKIRENDILIAASSGSIDVVGKAARAMADFDGSFGAFCKVLRPNSKVHPAYFAHFFKTREYRRRVSALASGININNLRNEHLDGLEIPLPSLSEQRRIADILDRAEALRGKRRNAIARLDALADSLFAKLLESQRSKIRKTSLGDAVDAIIDYRGKSPNKTAHGVPLITARVVKNKELLEPEEFIAADDYEDWMRRGLPVAGDVVFTTEAPLGEVAQLDDRRVALAQRLLVLRGKRSVLDNTFLMFALTSPDVAEQLSARSTGSTVRGIRQRELREVLLPLPPFDAQQSFARWYHALVKVKAISRASEKSLADLFNSQQHRAFRGEL